MREQNLGKEEKQEIKSDLKKYIYFSFEIDRKDLKVF